MFPVPADCVLETVTHDMVRYSWLSTRIGMMLDAKVESRSLWYTITSMLLTFLYTTPPSPPPPTQS